MSTLYRKYRPQTFADLIGQEHIAQTIKNEIATNKLAQAYLFSGPRGVGKTTLARLLAKAVNCEKRQAGEFEPCDKCSSCQEISAGKAIDVFEMDAATHTQVEKVRENIIETVQFQPAKSKFRVFIIDEVHMLSTSSFNALLKTLEEPPAHVMFILATTELHKLPATVVSRCQRFQFKKIGYDLMLERLKKISGEEGIKVDKDVFDRVIKKSDGCLRDAESLLGQIFTLDKKQITALDAELILPTSNSETVVNFVEFLMARQTKEALELIAKLAEEGLSFDQFALDLVEALRVAMFLKIGYESQELSANYSLELGKRLKKLALASTELQIKNLLDLVLTRRAQIKSSPLPQLPLELLAVEYGSVIPSAAEGSRASDTLDSSAPPPRRSESGSVGMTNVTKKPTGPVKAEITLPAESAAQKHTLTSSLKSAIQTITGRREPIKTTLEQIKAKWSDLILAITAQNHSLTFILSMASLTKVDESGLYLTLPYSLHKEKLEDRKTRTMIEACLEKEFGEKISLFCELPAKPAATTDSELSSLALEFGGEVVS